MSLVNNYVLLNIGRFRLTDFSNERRQFDYGLEICLISLYVCFEIVAKSNEMHARRLFNIKSIKRMNSQKDKLEVDFNKILVSTSINLALLCGTLGYFWFISNAFKVSVVHLSLPVA